MSATLNSRQARFVCEYLADRNGTQAAIRAGYSPRSARAIAHELLTKPDISAAVREKTWKLANELAVSRRRAIAELLEAAEYAKMAGNAMAIIQAWREVARLLDLYPRASHKPKSGPPALDLRTVPDHTLAAMATR